MVYPLLDLRRLGIGVRQLVVGLENAVIALAARHGIEASGRRDAPGVYVGAAKIAALGLRIKHGCSYHGVSLNIDMDLAPYQAINPCGYAGMAVTQLSACSPQWRAGTEPAIVGRQLAGHLARHLQTSDR